MDEMFDITKQADQLQCVSIVLTGGEPTLIKHEDLLRYFRYVKNETKIQNLRIVSNGHWAKTYDKAYSILKDWKEAGLDELNVSCGEFHQEFVPIDNIKHAFDAAIGLDYKTVLLGGEFIKSKNANFSPYDFEKKLGRKLMQANEISPFVDRNIGMSCHVALNVGRGEDNISTEDMPFVKDDEIPNICDKVITSLSFQPDGKVEACCAVMVRDHPVLTIANWREESVSSILEKLHSDLIINWIRYKGVKNLKGWLKDKDPGLTFKEQNNSICDICNEILLNEKCLDIICKHGHEEQDDIILKKISSDATIYSTDYKYINT